MATDTVVIAAGVLQEKTVTAAAGSVVFDAAAVLGSADAVWETVLESGLGSPPSFLGKVVWWMQL